MKHTKVPFTLALANLCEKEGQHSSANELRRLYAVEQELTALKEQPEQVEQEDAIKEVLGLITGLVESVQHTEYFRMTDQEDDFLRHKQESEDELIGIESKLRELLK